MWCRDHKVRLMDVSYVKHSKCKTHIKYYKPYFKDIFKYTNSIVTCIVEIFKSPHSKQKVILPVYSHLNISCKRRYITLLRVKYKHTKMHNEMCRKTVETFSVWIGMLGRCSETVFFLLWNARDFSNSTKTAIQFIFFNCSLTNLKYKCIIMFPTELCCQICMNTVAYTYRNICYDWLK